MSRQISKLLFQFRFNMIIGIDIGGTFTDVLYMEEAADGLSTLKVPSRQGKLEESIEEGLRRITEEAGTDLSRVNRIIHGSTVATNAILESSWRDTALITTEGFRDVLEIGRQNRPELYNFDFDTPEPIVERDARFEVAERINYEGEVLEPLDENSLSKIIEKIKQKEIDSVAVSLLFSYVNPVHEKKIAEHLKEKSEVQVTLSSEILPEFREYERTSTTALNAALQPLVGNYLEKLEGKSASLGFDRKWQIMQSNAGITTSRKARKKPINLVLSGPAAGVKGASYIGKKTENDDLITLDMGGTSCDVSLVKKGHIDTTTEGEIAGHPIGVPMVDIHTIGSGGGSIARIDEGGALKVGPESAGADPGPVCYSRGGDRPTVTDAHLVLGRIDPTDALGSLEGLDLEAAEKAIKEEIADPLNKGVDEAAAGILSITNANMERAIRVISVDRGHHPRDFSLLAFGGAGPLHAAELAAKLEIPRAIIPARAGVLSALGLTETDISHDFVRSLIKNLESFTSDRLKGIFERLIKKGEKTLSEEGINSDRIKHHLSADLRYKGQSHELNVKLAGEGGNELKENLADKFHEKHESLFGHSYPETSVELVNLRVESVGELDKFELKNVKGTSLEGARKEARPVYFREEGWVKASIYDRQLMPAEETFEGPAVVKGEESTILLPPETEARSDRIGNLILKIEGG